MNEPTRLIILGGTFDPVHVGHLIAARSAAEQLASDRVILMPASTPPHKPGPAAPAEHRLAMLRLAVDGDPLFEVSTLELDRDGPSYTVETLEALRRQAGPRSELIWLVGMDMLLELGKWYRAAEIVRLARVVTVMRPPLPTDLAARLAPLAETFGPEVVAQLARDVLMTPLIDVSSTAIRSRRLQGRSIRYMVPDAVWRHIEANALYAPHAAQR